MIGPQKRMSHQRSGLAVAALATKKGGREYVARMNFFMKHSCDIGQRLESETRQVRTTSIIDDCATEFYRPSASKGSNQTIVTSPLIFESRGSFWPGVGLRLIII